MRNKSGLLSVVSIALLLAGSTVWATGLDTNDPLLPPTDGEYVSPGPQYLEYNGGSIEIVLDEIVYRALAVPPPVRSNAGPDEDEVFECTVTGMAHVTILGTPWPVTPFTLEGLSMWRVFNKVGNETGLFDAEITSLDLISNQIEGPGSLFVTLIVRESPTYASMGQVAITDIGGGQYHIDSFFDVFTEVTVDGGQSFMAASAPVHIELVPEPATLAVLVLGGAALLRRKRPGCS